MKQLEKELKIRTELKAIKIYIKSQGGAVSGKTFTTLVDDAIELMDRYDPEWNRPSTHLLLSKSRSIMQKYPKHLE